MRNLAFSLVLLLGTVANPASAAYVVDIVQSGSNVVATGSGSLNVDALTVGPTGVNVPVSDGRVVTTDPYIALGSGLSTFYSASAGQITGPRDIGVTPMQISTIASTVSGPVIGLQNDVVGLLLNVPSNYVSGTFLSTSTSTFNGQSLASMNLKPGTYVWTWGRNFAGAPNTFDSFTLNILAPPVPVPEPATWAMMLAGFGIIGAALRRKRGSVSGVLATA